MKLLVVLLLAVVAQAEVHKFVAERNFMCTMCQTAAGLIINKKYVEGFDLCKDATGQEYTPVCRKVMSRAHMVQKWAAKTMDVKDMCIRLRMCVHHTQLSAAEAKWNRPAVNVSMIEEISRKGKWTAGVNKRFMGMTLAQVRLQLGTVVDPQHKFKMPPKNRGFYQQRIRAGNFDVRTQWPNCAIVSGDIRDQSACGSCWAFGSTEAYNDRNCIKTNGQDTTLFSPADTNSCCNIFQCGSQGCNGGQPTAAWHWFSKKGVVTGGDYSDNGKTDTCEPYTFPPCAHHVTSPDYKPCPSTEYRTPSCKSSCTNTGYAKGFASDKNMASQAYSLNSNSAIMADMQKYGSATAAFTVYEDFLSYKSGVYTHQSGQELGGHAIKFLGFGTLGGQDYWLVANSWNHEWGDNGTFKILRGANECGIESDVSAGQA